MNERVKKEMQERINALYTQCEQYKDQVAVIQFKYNAALAALEKTCADTGLHADQELINESMGI